MLIEYQHKAVLLNDPSYSVYYRYDFKDPALAREIERHCPSLRCSSRFFFTSYKEGGFINTHQDGHSVVDGLPSKYTVLVYLNNDYSGGDLVMPNVGLTLHPSPGTIVVMDQDIYHNVSKITQGQKYILRVDAVDAVDAVGGCGLKLN